jgi:PST family polysaccharide transporter
LSLAVFFNLVAGGQGALIQGMRRISDMAKLSVLGAVCGTTVSVPLVYFLGQAGIVPALVAVAGASFLASWIFSSKLSLQRPLMTVSEVRDEASALLRLGFAFMASGFLMLAAAYAVRAFVLRNVGVEAAGLYQSAFTLGGLYIGFILQAMSADFYPRLVGVCKDNAQTNRLVNEQARVSLLIAGPGVLGTLTFAPTVIALLYTNQFAGAVEPLRWICLGMALRIISWPMGYIVVAKGKQLVYFATELAWTAVNVAMSWLCIEAFGLIGAGVAFFCSYVFHALLLYPVVFVVTGFRWTATTARTTLLFLTSIGAVFGAAELLSPLAAMTFGAAATLASAAYSLYLLVRLSHEDMPPRVKRVMSWLKISPSPR